MTEADKRAVAHAVAATFNSLFNNELPQFEGAERIGRLLYYHINPWCTDETQKMLDNICSQLVELTK